MLNQLQIQRRLALLRRAPGAGIDGTAPVVEGVADVPDE